MRVLTLSNFYPPHHLGGYELSCRDVMERMARAGHRVTVLTSDVRQPGVDDPPDERGGAAVTVMRELHMWWDDHELRRPPLWARLREERSSHAALERAIEHSRPDVVSVWNMGALSLGLLTSIAERGLPMVFNVCDDWLLYGPRLDAWGRLFSGSPARRVVGQVVRRVAGVPTVIRSTPWPATFLFVSEATRAAARGCLGKATTAVVGSGIDLADFPLRSDPVVARPWRWRLLFVGRVEHRKGVETLLRALAALPDEASLDLVGPPDPGYARTVERLIAQLNLRDRVRTWGNVERSALRTHYEQADVFAFPSEWNEPFGLVPIEAMACDTPVVATGSGGSREFLVHDDNCLTFTAGDADALAAAVRRLASNAALRVRLVEAGRATAAAHDVDSLAETVTAWHERAASRP